MPSSCCAINCTNRCSKKMQMFRFPTDPERRRRWVAAVRREGWQPNEHSRICQEHFVNKKPSRMEYDVDYVPSVFDYSTKSSTSTTHSKLARYKRLISRRCKAFTSNRRKNKDDQIFVFDSSDVQQTAVLDYDGSSVNGDSTQEQALTPDCTDTVILNERSGDRAFDHSYANFNISQPADPSQDFNEQDKANLREEGNLEDGRMTELEELISKQGSLITLLKFEYRKALSNCSPFKGLESDDEQTKFYTGLPSYKIFDFLLKKLKPISPTYDRFGLSAGDQLLLVMRLGTAHKDLGYKFGIHVSRVTKIFHHWIDVMSRELQQLISWPDLELARETLPDCFKPKYTS